MNSHELTKNEIRMVVELLDREIRNLEENKYDKDDNLNCPVANEQSDLITIKAKLKLKLI